MRWTGSWIFAALLAVLGACSSDPEPKEPSTSKDVEILSFDAAPARIAPGEPTTLSWSTRHAATLEIFAGGATPVATSQEADGSVVLHPDESVTYRLVATGPAGERVERERRVEVGGSGDLRLSFSADRERMDFGSTVTLSWSSEEASRLVLTDGSDEPLLDTDGDENPRFSGVLEVSPDRSTVYTLEATGQAGDERVLEVEVEVVPVIERFVRIGTGPLLVGHAVELEWITHGADELVITTAEGLSYEIPEADHGNGEIALEVGASGTFVLRATRGVAETSLELQVPVGTAPTIVELTTSPEAVSVGQTTAVTLRWVVEGASSLSLAGADVGLDGAPVGEGSVELLLDGETTLVFTATNEAGAEVSRELFLPAVPLPVIESLVATPARVGVQEPFVISWTTTGASALELWRNDAPVAIAQDPVGSIEQVLDVSARYELIARNLAGAEVSRDLLVSVGAPVIRSFTADQPRYAAGASVGVIWEVDGGTSLTVSDSDGATLCTSNDPDEIADGACSFTAPTSFGLHPYDLVVENALGLSASASISILVSDGPVIVNFTTSDATLAQGEAITFSWTVLADLAGELPSLTLVDEEANELMLEELLDQPLGGSGSLVLDQPGPHTYTLTASTPGTFDAVASVEVEVVGTPVISSLTATPDPVTAGQSVTLAWTTDFASALEIVALDDQGHVTTSLETISDPAEVADGSRLLPPVFGVDTVSYRLVARNRLGVEAGADVSVTVELPDAGFAYFNVTPASISAGDTVDLSWAAYGGDVTLTPGGATAPTEITATAAFVDIGATGTPITLGGCGMSGIDLMIDEGCGDIAFPADFRFPFDGSERAGARVFANGVVSFDLGPEQGSTYDNFDLPTTMMPFVHLAPFWDALTLGKNANADLRWQHFVDPAGDHLIIQWSHLAGHPMGFWSSFSADISFQVILFANGAVDFRYGTMTSDDAADANGSSAVVGVQNTSGTAGHGLLTRFSSMQFQDRSWRYFEEAHSPIDGLSLTLNRTTIFTLCLDLPTGRLCETRTVVVN